VHSPLPAGVHVLERGWLSSNNILFLGVSGTALVDSGYATHAAQTLGLIERLLDGRSLDRLLNTHLHSDHCGGNAALQARYAGVCTAIPPGEAEAVRRWDEDKLSYRATGQVCPRFSFDSLLQPGQEIELADARWQIHAAPGHDPHAVLLYEPASGVLISGDALWEKGFGIVFPEMWGEPSFGEVAATLDLIESLNPRCVIPGHGRYFGDARKALATARGRLDAFIGSPEKHARHAVKVLIKFKLLEVRKMTFSQLAAWLVAAAYMEQIRQRFAADRTLNQWGEELVAELARSGAVRVEDRMIYDA
jgi:glyoxylase-like metal-dependent hydrolase (beta-lactamase superfamily II)